MSCILMYHFVADTEDDEIFKKQIGIDVSEFKRQIEILLRNYQPLKEDEIRKALKGGYKLPEKSFYLTFDEGFKQHIDNVLPVLSEYNLEGTFFITTAPLAESKLGFVEKQRYCQYSIYPEYIDFLREYCRMLKTHADITFEGYMEPEEENIKSKSDYLREHDFYSDQERFYRWLRDEVVPGGVSEDIIGSIFASVHDEKDYVKRLYMDWQELRNMQKEGMKIGGHSHTHPLFSALDSSALKKEVDINLELLEGNLIEPIKSFAYPYGVYGTEKIFNILKNRSIDIAYSTGNRKTDFQNRYDLNRLDCSMFDKVFNGVK